ncbi:MAG: Ig-like domain-containing protein [Armatimonadota bacterium]|nr:Ig-like domain-containing protein [Armatimonadota bacterium]
MNPRTGVLSLLLIVWSGVAFGATPLYSIKLSASPQVLLSDGKSVALLSAEVRDGKGNLAPDGTQVQFSASQGVLRDTVVSTSAGMARTQLTSSSLPGVATITATIPGASAFGEVRVVFTDDPEMLRQRVNVYLFNCSQYLAYSADWRTVEAVSSDQKAEFIVGNVRLQARSYQYRMDEDVVIAEGAVLTRGKRTLVAERLRYYPRRDEGQAVIIEDGQIREVVFKGPLWEQEPVVFNRPDAYTYNDLSSSELLFVAQNAALLPNERIQFRQAKMYVAGQKLLTIPMYDLSFRSGEALGQQIVGINSGGLTLDLPFYYVVSPQAVGALRLRHGYRVGRAVYAIRPGWTLDLEHSYSRPGLMEGAFVLTSLLRGDWGIRWNHAHWFSQNASSHFYIDVPAHRNLYVNSGLSYGFGQGRIGLNLSGGQNLSGTRYRDLRSDLYVESNPFKLGSQLKMTISTTFSSRLSEIADQRVRTDGAGLRSRLYTTPLRLAGFTVNSSLMASYLWGNSQTTGSSLLATVSASRGLWDGALLSLTYDYTHDRLVQVTGYGKHRLSGMFAWSVGQRLNASLVGTRILDSDSTTLFADASYRLSSLWRLGANFSFNRFQGTRYNDLELSIGYRIGVRELLLTWSSLTRRWQIDLIAAGF